MICAICNPIAGSGRGKKIGTKIKQALFDRCVPCRYLETEGRRHRV